MSITESLLTTADLERRQRAGRGGDMLSEGRVVRARHRAFTARGRDLAVRHYRPIGLAWRFCDYCGCAHAVAGSPGSPCPRLAKELTRSLEERGHLWD